LKGRSEPKVLYKAGTNSSKHWYWVTQTGRKDIASVSAWKFSTAAVLRKRG